MEPAVIFQKAWDILVEHAGASKDPDARTSFVHAYTERKFPASEWREAIIEKVNALLTELPYFHP